MLTTRKLSIDLETYSEVDLKGAGVFRYVADPSFEVLLFGYAFDNDPVQVIDIASGGQLPDTLLNALVDPKVLKTAYNASFEMTCLTKYLMQVHHVTLKPEQWRCTAVRAANLGLPRSLADVGRVLHINSDKQKLASGSQLISYFCKPCAPTQTNGNRTRNYPHHYPERWQLFKDYNIRDIEAEREIDNVLDTYQFQQPSTEHKLWLLDYVIARKGVLIDIPMVHNILAYTEKHQQHLLAKANDMTGLKNANSRPQLLAWLNEQGLDTENLKKDTVKDLLKTIEDPAIKEVLKMRQEMSKTSIAKFQAMADAVDTDHRIRGMLQFYGANRTGRWSSKIVQLQNLPSNTMHLLHEARGIVKANDMDWLEFMYNSPLDIFSQLIRTALIPPPGHVFVVADYSAIEARVISWLAQEQWRMDVFASHGRIYEATASRMFNIAEKDVGKTSPERKKAKVAELACGYQGGVKAMERMGGSAAGLSEDDMKKLVTDWREANPNIVKLWKTVETAAIEAVANPGSTVTAIEHVGVTYHMNKNALIATLPSGRQLSYFNATLKRDDKYNRMVLFYDGVDQESGKWIPISTYGGQLTENLCQAIARDCLAEALLYLAEEGFIASFHVHDEVVVEVPLDKATDALESIKWLMTLPTTQWTFGLPLRADGYIAQYYYKD